MTSLWELHHSVRTRSPLPASPLGSSSTPNHHDRNSEPNNTSTSGKTVSWETQPGTPKLQKDSSKVSGGDPQLGSANHALSSSLTKDIGRKTQQQQQPVRKPQWEKEPPVEQSKFRTGDGAHFPMAKAASFDVSGIRQRSNGQGRYDEMLHGSMDLESKHYYEEESPVSTLDRFSSPPTNSSGSSGSSRRSPRGIVSAYRGHAPAPAAALSSVSSSSSSSLYSSPGQSTSSSTRYTGQCLIALQAALAADPETLKRFEESFVELDPLAKRGMSQNSVLTDSPINRPMEVIEQGSPVWEGEGASELEPEYNAISFYSDDHGDNQVSTIPAEALTRSYSSSSVIGRSITQSLSVRRARTDEYSVKHKRFLSDHHSSYGADSIRSLIKSESLCSSSTRHEEVPWDDQQGGDLGGERAEEVVRGVVDGLRFTYSPVSSAFVFNRSNEVERPNLVRRTLSYNAMDSGRSQQFSMHLDSARSFSTEDYSSVGRASDVTELRLSRAESWSKVARSYEDAVPINLPRSRLAYGQSNANSTATATGFNPHLLVDHKVTKKTRLASCLPIRSIVKNLTTIAGSPGRSRFAQQSAANNVFDRRLQFVPT